MQQISIIIVNWNTGGLLIKCLESIVALSEQDLIRHVVIVDNASTDDSVLQTQEIAQEHGYAIIRAKHNLGFAKANNLAWKFIKEHEGNDDHILLLNPDTEVRPGALKSLVEVFEKNKTVGIVGPKLLETTGKVQKSVRTFPTFVVFIILFLKLQRLFPGLSIWERYMMTNFDYLKEQQVDQVMGAAFLIRNEVLKQIGLLDESFWIWFEEVDFCKRAKQSGWSTLYTPSAVVTHHGGTSFGQVAGFTKTRLFTQSSILYTKKHLGITAYITLLAFYPIGLLIAIIASFEHIKQRKYNISCL
ncbi:MAG TPA: glycosyltransferase family 2 protein [Candidatus Andersenbacteria bacterium]|nr:glycosyltransferase family 2 protein [Candidatus Andersenbacteria bacterium]